MPRYRRPIPGNSGMYNLADSMFLALSFPFEPFLLRVQTFGRVSMPLDFYSFPFFMVYASVCKASCPRCVIGCFKFPQRSIRGTFFTKRLGMTMIFETLGIGRLLEETLEWYLPGTQQIVTLSGKCIRQLLLLLWENLFPLLPPPSLPCSSSQVDGTFRNRTLVFCLGFKPQPLMAELPLQPGWHFWEW